MEKLLLTIGIGGLALFLIFGLREIIASAVLKALEEFEIRKEKNREFSESLNEFGPFQDSKTDVKRKSVKK